MQKNRSIIGKFHYTFVFTAIAQRLEKFLINDFRTLEGMKFRGFRLIPRLVFPAEIFTAANPRNFSPTKTINRRKKIIREERSRISLPCKLEL